MANGDKLKLDTDNTSVIVTEVEGSVDFEIIDAVARYTTFYLTTKEITQLIVFLQNTIKH